MWNKGKSLVVLDANLLPSGEYVTYSCLRQLTITDSFVLHEPGENPKRLSVEDRKKEKQQGKLRRQFNALLEDIRKYREAIPRMEAEAMEIAKKMDDKRGIQALAANYDAHELR